MKNRGLRLLLLAIFLLLPLAAIKAADGRTGANIYVAKDDIISGNYYAAGETITIDGTIGGDLIVAGQTINVNGLVEGDIIAAGQNISINGPVGGNVRVAGNSITINNTVARNVNAFGANIVLGGNSRIGWDVYAAGAAMEMRGVIDGRLNGYAGQAVLAGKIGKDVDLNLSGKGTDSRLDVASSAMINGDLNYTSANAASVAAQASIAGQTEHKTPVTRSTNWLLVWLWAKLFSIFSVLVVGLVLIFGLKNFSNKVLSTLEENPVKNILPGLIGMLIVPPIAIIFAATVIGLPLALILAALWLILCYIAKIFTAIWIGHLLVTKISQEDWSLAWSLALGVIILWFVSAIPFIGWLISLFAVWLGLGALWSYAYNQYRNL